MDGSADPKPTDFSVPGGVTLGEMALLVLGTALGISRAVQMDWERQTLGDMMGYVALMTRSGRAPGAHDVFPVFLMLPLSGVLMAGLFIVAVRWTRGVALGAGLALWAALGLLAIPYWMVAPEFYSRGKPDWLWLSVFGPAVLAWCVLCIGTIVVGTVVCLRRRRQRLLGWTGLVLSWVWLAVLVVPWLAL